jgi:kynureninase
VTFDTKDTTEVKAFVNGRLKLILNKLSDPANKTVTLGSFVRIGYYQGQLTDFNAWTRYTHSFGILTLIQYSSSENNVFTHMEKTFER